MYESLDFVKLSANHKSIFYNLHKLQVAEILFGILVFIILVALVIFHTFEWLIITILVTVMLCLVKYRKGLLEEYSSLTVGLEGSILTMRLYENWNSHPIKGWVIDLAQVEKLESDDKSVKLYGPYKIELFDVSNGDRVGEINETAEIGRVIPVTVHNCFQNWDKLCDQLHEKIPKAQMTHKES